MEVHFSQEQEARLSDIANHQGVNTTQLVKDAALRLLNEEEQFRAAVREGIDAAERGDFVSHEQVWGWRRKNFLRLTKGSSGQQSLTVTGAIAF